MTRLTREPTRTVVLLFCAQALAQAAQSGQVAMVSLIGYALAEAKALATLPLAVQMLATMAVSIPGAVIFARLGRRAGFLMGAALYLSATAIFFVSLWIGSFHLFLFGCIFSGAAFGIAQYYRFAAAEVADAAYRPKAISTVMAGGVIGAFLGPAVVKATKDWFAPVLFAGSYLAFAALPFATAALVFAMRLAPPADPRGTATVQLGPILGRPRFIVAVLSAVVGWDTMNILMAATPLEMMLCGFTVGDSATVIQWHAAAMFAPSFLTGHLITRFGVVRVIAVGAALIAACAVVALAGQSFAHFWVALVALGVGWNFMFVGGTALLTSSYRPEERAKAQAANDVIVFGSVAITSVLSGALHHWVGWAMLNVLVFPALAVALVGLVKLARIEAAPLPRAA